jgi:hypothetical protein
MASKVGLRSLAFSLASEVGEASGVSVYCFGPGIVDTPGAQAAFKRLAPYYRMTVDEFIAQSGMTMISAELCATGLVGTILHAKEFHGQETGFAAGLTRLGLTSAGELIETESGSVPDTVPLPLPQEGDRERLEDALVLNRQVEDIVRTNRQEYDSFPLFVRPIAKRMFQQGTGMSIEDWITHSREMSKCLERIAHNGKNHAPSDASLLQEYGAQLKRMADFIGKQETEISGWFKDPQQLKAAQNALRERKATVLKLVELLNGEDALPLSSHGVQTEGAK